MSKKIVLLSGWKQSGKTTIGNYLEDKHGYKQLALADFLKDLCSDTFNIPRKHFEDGILKETFLEQFPVDAKDGLSATMLSLVQANYFLKPRDILILVAGALRAVDKDIFITKVVDRIMNLTADKIVISDCRYINEMSYFKATFDRVTTLRVNRFDVPPSDSPSENNLNDYPFDISVNNKGSVKELYANIDKIFG